MKTQVRKIVLAAMLAALTCIATMIIKIPSPLKGYVNLGDCAVLLSGWLLPPFYGFLAAGIGSSLADMLLGYAVYAPATFVIKGLMALCAGFIGMRMHTSRALPAYILSGIVAELLMVLGYFVFEGFLYGFLPSVVNILPNAVQGVFGVLFGVVLIKIFKKTKMMQ